MLPVTARHRKKSTRAELNGKYSLSNRNTNNIQKNVIHNSGLFTINKPKIHWDSYFEMSMIYSCSLKKMREIKYALLQLSTHLMIETP